MSGPSDKAIEALASEREWQRQERANALGFWEGRSEPLPPEKAWGIAASEYREEKREEARRDLEVAHDPALGLDRSVCVRDVVEALRGGYRVDDDLTEAADFIEREFSEPGE